VDGSSKSSARISPGYVPVALVSGLAEPSVQQALLSDRNIAVSQMKKTCNTKKVPRAARVLATETVDLPFLNSANGT
jgi:hypothetical protein